MMKRGVFLLLMLFCFSIPCVAISENYVARKMSSIPERPDKAVVDIRNDSIAVKFDDVTGQFNIGKLPGDITLIFYYPSSPGTSNTVFNIDNYSTAMYVNESWASGWATWIGSVASTTIPFVTYSASSDSPYIEGGWVVNNIRFIQKVMPVYLERPDGRIAGSVLIQYRVRNLGTVSRQIGVRLQLDTMIDDNDAARVSTVYGYNNYEQVFYEPDIPAFYTAYRDTLPSGMPNPASLKATGYLSPSALVPDAVTPRRFALGYWPTFRDLSSWYYTTPGGSYWDSSVLIWWENTLAPGDSVVYGTYYGIGLPDWTPPVAQPLVPRDGIWTACAGTDIAVKIRDNEVINESTIRFAVNGNIYTTADPQLTWLPTDSLLIFQPANPFPNNSTVNVSLLAVSDMEGNALSAPVSWSFRIDDLGPTVTNMSPNGTLAPSLSPTLTCDIIDGETRVDETSIRININGTIYNWGTPGMSYNSMTGRFTFDLALAGIVFPTGHTVNVQIVRANDMPDTCSPHLPRPHTWSFFTSIPPVPVLITPAESVITTCEDEEVWIDLSSGSGIDPSTISFWVNNDRFVIADPELSLIRDTLYFRPSGYYTYNTGPVTVCIDSVSDTLGAWSSRRCWVFFVDLVSPVMSAPSPTSPPMITTANFDVSMSIADAMLPVDSTSIIVQLINNNNRDTTVVTYYTAFSTWSNPIFSFPINRTAISLNDGEVVTVRLLVRDLPPPTTDCAGNLLDTSFTFQVAPTPCKRAPNPITPGRSPGINDEVLFEFPNMRKTGETVHIFIYDLRNNLVADITQPVAGSWRWTGKDTAGEQLSQGTYLYLIKVGDEVVCNGTISIAR